MEFVKGEYFAVHLTEEEIRILKKAKEITEDFFNALEDKRIFYQDYIDSLSDQFYIDVDNINDILIQGNNVPVKIE